VLGIADVLKSWNKPWVEEIAKDLGAKCKYSINLVDGIPEVSIS
jgi:hypothetical protein